MKIRVLFENSIFLHQNTGGISKYIDKLNKRLNNHGIDSKIFCFLTINKSVINSKNSTFFLRLNKIPRFCRKLFFLINDLTTILYSYFYKPDFIHFTYYNNFLIKFINRPYLLTVYDLIHEKKKYASNIFKKKNVIKNAYKIICISEETKKELIKYYKLDSKIIDVIKLGVDNYSIKKKKIKKGTRYILHVGNRSRYKNFKMLLKAYSSSKFLKDNYDLMCFGGENFTHKEIKLFERLGVSNRLKFKTGNDRYLNQAYKNAHLFVTVSKEEGFGLTAFEAISLGCPTVCSNIPTFRENLRGYCQFVNPNSYKDIRIGIESVLINTSRWHNLSQKGKKIYHLYNWNKTAKKTALMYKKCYHERKKNFNSYHKL